MAELRERILVEISTAECSERFRKALTLAVTAHNEESAMMQGDMESGPEETSYCGGCGQFDYPCDFLHEVAEIFGIEEEDG